MAREGVHGVGAQKKVYRLEPNGPAGIGLKKMKLDPADFQSDLPEQHLHVYFEAESLGLRVGVWTTTPMQEAFGPYPGDEFMWVLEGRVAMVDADGKETPVQEGETLWEANPWQVLAKPASDVGRADTHRPPRARGRRCRG